MIIEIDNLNLALVSPAVAGAALKILALGGSKLDAKQMGRAAGSAHLIKTHEEEIRTLVGLMEEHAVPKTLDQLQGWE
jgi:hypothetical protein